MSGVISEGGERLRVFLDGKTRAAKRGPKIAPRDVITAAAQAFARNEIDRAEPMRRITPSLGR